MSVTIKDIAKVANVSYATVSRALNDKKEISKNTRKKIKEIAEKLGYTPNALAKGLVKNNSQTIGLILPDITNPFFPEVAQGIEDIANKNGFHVFLCNTNWELEREIEYLRALYGKRVDGIVITPASNEINHIIEYVDRHLPVVFAAYRPQIKSSNFVVTDDYKCAKIAVEYLIKLGHRKIAFVGGLQSSSSNTERCKGYIETLATYGILYNFSYVKYGKFKKESGYRLTIDLLLESDVPTAIIAGNDVIALGVIQAVEEFGLRVPENISVIGFDDVAFAAIDKIQLTTIHQDKYKIGELCVEILIEKIMKPDDKDFVHRVLEPSIVIRKTCKGI